MQADILKALVSLVGKEGINHNTVADEVIKLVPGATHEDVASALGCRVKDLFDHEPFPSDVHMGWLNKGDRSPAECRTTEDKK